jgi:RNA polymerase sigma-70 factor, ECF subfamily
MMLRATGVRTRSDGARDGPSTWLDDHGDALFAYARVHAPHDVAEDLVQETLLAAMKGDATFNGRSSRRTWLIGILRHKLADHVRQRRRFRADDVVLATLVERSFDDSGRWVRPPGPWRVGVGDLGRADVQKALEECLRRLPTRTAEVFLLREHAGLDVQRLCQVLNTTPTNVWTMLYRARTVLRECLEQSCLTDRRPDAPCGK